MCFYSIDNIVNFTIFLSKTIFFQKKFKNFQIYMEVSIYIFLGRNFEFLNNLGKRHQKYVIFILSILGAISNKL